MVITMPESLAILFEDAMAAAGFEFECTGAGAGTSEYIVSAPIDHIRDVVSQAAAEAIEVIGQE